MELIKFPELTDFTIYTYVFYIVLGLIVFKSESAGIFNLPYSKFAKGNGINPRIGMFIIYFLPILAYSYTWSNASYPNSIYHLVLLFAFNFHFGKRCLEVLFLHKFSGKIGTLGVIFITIAYSNIAFLCGNLNNSKMTIAEGSKISIWLIVLGLIIFAIGQAGNYYHHKILFNLRKDLISKEYLIPISGLFEKLVCPHYLFELISWLGIAVISTFFDSYLMLFIMTCYLMGRSHKTREWYQEKFPNFPEDRFRIFPWIY